MMQSENILYSHNEPLRQRNFAVELTDSTAAAFYELCCRNGTDAETQNIYTEYTAHTKHEQPETLETGLQSVREYVKNLDSMKGE